MTLQEYSEPAQSKHDVFTLTRFILVQPSHPGNVGSAARAIKTMGFSGLHLVNPGSTQIHRHSEAIALASGALDVLENCQIHPSLTQALAPVATSFALSARPRHLGPQALDIRQAAALAGRQTSSSKQTVAMVFGCERYGLSNEDMSYCNYVCHIPANPAYSSLNLSQAVQLVAWEMRYVLLGLEHGTFLPDTHGKHDSGGDPASHQELQYLLEHFEQTMLASGFLQPQHPKKLLVRMRQMWLRKGLSKDEVAMLRGYCTAVIAKLTKIPD